MLTPVDLGGALTAPPDQWTQEDDQTVNADIQGALRRNHGDVKAAWEDLKAQRQDPKNFYDTNLAIAEDYLYARYDTANNGALVTTAQIDTYMAMKQVWVPQEGAGPVSPYSDKEKAYMLKGVDDAQKVDGKGAIPSFQDYYYS